jgi:hypothetical protein
MRVVTRYGGGDGRVGTCGLVWATWALMLACPSLGVGEGLTLIRTRRVVVSTSVADGDGVGSGEG